MNHAIREIKGSGVTWINVTRIKRTELGQLGKRFGFLDIDLEACLPPNQRPKLDARSKYLFMILLYPHFDRQTRLVRAVEVDFFITKKYIITVHSNELEPLRRNFDLLSKDGGAQGGIMNSPADLLYRLLEELVDYCQPMLVHIAEDIDNVEARLGEMHNRKVVNEIYRIKTNIVNFKKAMKPHTSVIRRLIASVPRFFKTGRLQIYFESLADRTQEIWDNLENDSSTIDAIEDSHVQLLNVRTSDIMRALTLFAVIVFPLTLVAAIFGMNTVYTPFVGQPNDFWIIVSLMIAGTLAMLAFFKWKKWL